MSPAFVIRLFAAATLLATLAAHAQTALLQPNWSLQEAREAAAQVDTLTAVRPLFRLARAGRNDELLQALDALANRAEWPEPAREQALYLFALGLADLPPGAVSRKVTAWLLAYSPRTLVPHEDSPLTAVPLYRIGTAAAGSLHAWARQLAASEAGRLLEESPEAWLTAFGAADPVRRRGFLDALDGAGTELLRQLSEQALERLPGEPSLTPVVARAGLRLPDPALLQATVIRGGGPDLAPALRSAARQLDEAERTDLLFGAVRHAPATNASLAIAELAPGLLRQPEVEALLFEQLADRGIGSAAALALGKSKNPQILERLDQLARDGEGLAASRASIAVETARAAREGSGR